MAASRPIFLIPATLKESSLDSPTFRGTVLHYAEQVDLVEKWLDGFIKASTKLVNEVLGLEGPINNFLLLALPNNISESVVDHDYTLLAMQRYAEGSKGFWTNIIVGAKKVEKIVVEPLLAFQRGELKNFKETRMLLTAAQSKYDALLARYLSQSKSKEPSALREDAFGLYEARKAYIKICFDFCVAAPLFRSSLDRLLTKVISNQWREQIKLRKDTGGPLERCGSDVERIRSCCDAMEANESVFLKQLAVARTELERRTKKGYQPGRELDEYSISTVPYLTRQTNIAAALEGDRVVSEKQGWLFMRTLSGKPTRSVWIRRWFFVKAGIFGWLVQGYRSGGAEESEKVGVLLCNIKPAFQEERRFCFEVKTKDTTILLQTETQADLTSWLDVFEQARRAAVASSSLVASTQAFSILPPSAPAPLSEPAYVTKGHDGNTAGSVTPVSGDGLSLNPLYTSHHLRRDGKDEGEFTFRHAATTGPGTGGGAYSRAASMDISRVLDASSLQPSQHRKAPSALGERSMSSTGLGGPGGTGGISALIAASHSFLPFPIDPSKQVFSEQTKPTSLTPNTLSSTPSPVNLLTAATVTTGSGLVGIPNGGRGHKRTVSLDHGREIITGDGDKTVEYFPGYPIELRVQDEHFRMLFPETRDSAVLLVFCATWSPNDTQELPGRCFVTDRNLYFYSHYLGLVFSTIIPFLSVQEVKATPEKECDYLFLHLKPDEREEDSESPNAVTIKTYLEPLRPLQRRLHCLVKNANLNTGSDTPKLGSRELLKELVAMGSAADERSMDEESWEDDSLYLDGNADSHRRRGAEGFTLRIDTDGIGIRAEEKARGTVGQIKLPSAPVIYTPSGMIRKSLERDYDVTPKALFHVMFGEKSSVFQTLYAQRRSQPIHQGHWKDQEKGKARRQFAYRVSSTDMFGRTKRVDVVDHQTIEKQEDHHCYVATDIKTPWHLPHRQDFIMVSKIVITHVAESKSKLSVWTRVDWFKDPKFSKGIVQKQALDDLDNDALDLGDVVADAIKKLTTSSRNPDAVAMFGTIGGTQEPPPPSQPPTDTIPKSLTAASAPSPASGDLLCAPRIPIKHHGLSHMVLENGLSFTESAVVSVFMGLAVAVKKCCSIVSTHRVLLLVLALSVTANVSLSARSTRAFWSERRASRFLQDVDVRPDGIMARSITLQDLSEAVAPLQRVNASGSCGHKFWTSPRTLAGQEKLGIVRHDLVVALRVINGMEREMVNAQWERWVVQEQRRCRVVAKALGGLEDHGTLMEYCGDCDEAGRRLLKERGLG